MIVFVAIVALIVGLLFGMAIGRDLRAGDGKRTWQDGYNAGLEARGPMPRSAGVHSIVDAGAPLNGGHR